MLKNKQRFDVLPGTLREGDVCFYPVNHPSSKSLSIVKIVKILDDVRGCAEIKYIDVIRDETGNGFLKYMLGKSGTMAASLLYMKKQITPNDFCGGSGWPLEDDKVSRLIRTAESRNWRVSYLNDGGFAFETQTPFGKSFVFYTDGDNIEYEVRDFADDFDPEKSAKIIGADIAGVIKMRLDNLACEIEAAAKREGCL